MHPVSPPHPIALVLYPGCALRDVAETLTRLGSPEARVRLTTVAARIRPLAVGSPIRLLAERTFDEVPTPMALIVPGGDRSTVAALADRELIGYVQAAAGHAEVIAAIGTGSLVLAAAGILKGRTATTQPEYADSLHLLGASYSPLELVADGPILTAADSRAAQQLASAIAQRLTPVPPGPFVHPAEGDRP